MSRALKETITCVDCSGKRQVTKACLKLVKRCKPCQAIFNRDQARNRYRKIHNISTKIPVKIPKKKKKEPTVKHDFLRPTKPFEPPKPVKKLTPKEEAKFLARSKKLFKLLGGDYNDTNTNDDW